MSQRIGVGGISRKRASGAYVSIPTFTDWLTLYISPNGSDTNYDGRSKRFPFATLTQAHAYLAAHGNAGRILGGPGLYHATTELSGDAQGIQFRGSGPAGAVSGGTEIMYEGPDDGRAAIATAASASLDFTHGRLGGFRLTCASGYTQAVGLLARDLQNMCVIEDIVIKDFPGIGLKVVDTLGGVDHQFPGYCEINRVWVVSATSPRPIYLTPGTTTMIMDLCGVDGGAGTTEAIYIDNPNGGGTRARDFRLSLRAFKTENIVDCYGLRILPDTNVHIDECTFQQSTPGTKAAVRYEGVPADPNDPTDPTVWGTWTSQGFPIWFEAPNTTPAVKLTPPVPTGGTAYRDEWPPRRSGPFYGDGVDGDLVLDGTTTVLGMVPAGSTYSLTRDIFANTIAISPGVSINANGWRMHARQWIHGPASGTGTIKNNGGAGATAGTAGGTSSVNSINTNTAGGAGGTAAGSAAGGGTRTCGGAGGAGGAGTGGAGGAAGAVSAPSVTSGGANAPRRFPECFGTAFTASGSWGGGTGGGGGGGDGTAGGGGGAGGGVVVVAAPRIGGNLTIQANGGNGGNAGGTNCGGGGGGGGGVVSVITTRPLPTSVTLQANKGTGGTKTGTGVAGTDGANGLTVTTIHT